MEQIISGLIRDDGRRAVFEYETPTTGPYGLDGEAVLVLPTYPDDLLDELTRETEQ